jgi:DNA mismatch repair protein MutS2
LKVLVDIGDSQSIEDVLSTFSSHLTNIKNILENASDKSLVLLDEIGTGTDPAEGSAIATGVLVSLRDKGAKVLATTHHGSLKIFANQTEKFQNASMEFDTEELKPTYRFKTRNAWFKLCVCSCRKNRN